MSNQITFLLVFLIGIQISSAQTDPSNIVCQALNSTTLSLTWDQATAPSVEGYFLFIERVDGLRIEPDIPSVNLNLKTYDNYQFYGLGKYGTYNITIHSYTSVTNLTSYVTTCTTAEDVPNSAPQTFYCTGASTSSIRCTWSELEQVYWNGVPLEEGKYSYLITNGSRENSSFRLQWLSSNLSSLYETTVGSNVTTTLVTGLLYGTLYYVMLNPYTSIGQGTVYSTTSAYTQGVQGEAVENVTRYYCNEAVPGFLVFGWEEMPCTIYTGTISALFVICGLFIGIIACMSCCSKPASNDVSINFLESSPGKRRRNRDDDDYSDDGDSDNDDDNDDNMTDNHENDAYNDDDGYENKGYRSDEEARSPDSRKLGSPDDDMNSRVTPDITPSRQTDMSGGKESKKMELERQLTARDVELEPISENEDALSDSDYDSQSEYDDETDVDVEQESTDNVAKASGIVIFASKELKVKGKKNVKGINANGGAKSTAKPANKNNSSTIALVHTEVLSNSKTRKPKEKADVVNSRNLSPLSPLQLTQSSDGIIPPDDDWGDDYHAKINGNIVEDALPDTNSTRLSQQKSTGKISKKSVRTEDDWDDFGAVINDTTDNKDAMTRTEDDDWESPIHGNAKNTKTKIMSQGQSNLNKLIHHNTITTSEANDWDDETNAESYKLKGHQSMQNNYKMNNSNILQRENKRTSANTNGYELKPLNLKSSQRNNQLNKPSDKEIYNGNFSNDRVKKTSFDKLKEDDWGIEVTHENKKGPRSIPNGVSHIGKMTKESNMTVSQTQNHNETDHNLKHNLDNNREPFDGIKNKTEHRGEETSFITSASNNGKHMTPAPITANKSKQNTISKTMAANNPPSTEQHSRNDKAKHQEKAEVIARDQPVIQMHDRVYSYKNQKQMESKQIPNQKQHTIGSKQLSSNSKNCKSEQKTMFFIEDEIDNVTLPTYNILRPDSEPKGKKISTKAWLPHPNSSIKSGRRTPVKAFPKVQSWTSIEIEPVLGSDRLGKKFPFLSIDNINTEMTNQNKAESSDHLRKNVSDSELTKPSFNDSTSYTSVPKRISEGDVLSKLAKAKTEPRDKIFYGFGTGRFRNIAAAWINKFRSKKNPVKTAHAAW